MKGIAKKVISGYLRGLTRAVMIRFRPTVVGIAGSMGKTRTKDAIKKVLSAEFTVRANPRSYNTEIGLPLAVLNLETGGSNVFKWLRILFLATIRTATSIQFPSLLVLELGTDTPGDMDHLLSMVRPEVLVVTSIEPAHLGNFEDAEQAAQEIEKAVRALKKHDLLVLNSDDPWVLHMRGHAKCPVITFGKKSGDVRAVKVTKSREFQKIQTRYKKDDKKHIHVYKIYGTTEQHLYGLLAAIAVGIHYKIGLGEATKLLEKP